MTRAVLPVIIFISTLVACGSGGDSESLTSEVIHNNQSAFEDIDPDDLPIFSFLEESFDFGKITQGEKVKHIYEFTNTGKSNLIITDVEGSCGCTVSKNWPKQPVKPGEVGQIEVEFDSENKQGIIKKYVSIIANTSPATSKLVIEGEVVVPVNLK